MNILITGGCGYIGSALVHKLSKDHNIIIFDNLSNSEQRVCRHPNVFIEGDLNDSKALEKVFMNNKIDVVMHLAAYKDVGESETNKVKYSNNIIGTINLLNCIAKYKVKQIIFSSTASLYSGTNNEGFTESQAVYPLNFYGKTKLYCEKLIQDYSDTYCFNYIIFRYFNVVGSYGIGYKDVNSKNLLPICLDVLTGKREVLSIYGDSYDTPDGTCIRDYVDLSDIVLAHQKAMNVKDNLTINLGTGEGYSVKQIVRLIEKLSGKTLNVEIGRPRKGDPAKVITNNSYAKEILNWEPQVCIEDSIKSMF